MRHRKTGRARGQSLVELAIMLVLFLLALFMVIDWGWVYFQRHELNRRVTNAARWGAVRDLIGGNKFGDPTFDCLDKEDPCCVNKARKREVENIVLCDDPNGGCSPIFSLGAGNGKVVVGEQVGGDNIYGPDYALRVPKCYVTVTVKDFQFHHIAPFYWNPVTSADITSRQPAEPFDVEHK